MANLNKTKKALRKGTNKGKRKTPENRKRRETKAMMRTEASQGMQAAQLERKGRRGRIIYLGW
jgi:hypothetical protein